MLRKIRQTMIAVSLLVGVAGVSLPAYVGAAIPQESKDAACAGIGEATGGGCDGTADTSVRDLLASVINLLSWIVGIVAIIMIIIGGFKYVTSNGDSNGITSAKHTVLYALVGVAVAVLAQVLVRFAISTATKTTP